MIVGLMLIFINIHESKGTVRLVVGIICRLGFKLCCSYYVVDCVFIEVTSEKKIKKLFINEIKMLEGEFWMFIAKGAWLESIGAWLE